MKAEINPEIGLEDIFLKTEAGKKALIAFGAAIYFFAWPPSIIALGVALGFLGEGIHQTFKAGNQHGRD